MPVLPVTDAGKALIESLPITGPIIVILFAAIFGIAYFYVRREREHRVELATAKDAHIAMLEKVLPAMHDSKEAMNDLKETVLTIVANRGRRT